MHLKRKNGSLSFCATVFVVMVVVVVVVVVAAAAAGFDNVFFFGGEVELSFKKRQKVLKNHDKKSTKSNCAKLREVNL